MQTSAEADALRLEDYRAQAATLVRRMTLEEKAALCSGRDFWSTKPIERLGIPSISVADGPHGLRKVSGSEVTGSLPATCFPTASALAASWDVDLLRQIGQALGREAQASDVQILLGPGVNMKRSPLCGRNFEYFSEDPRLSGELAAAYIRGVQSRGVGTSLKHFAANNQEFERMTMNASVDERTLREIYLTAFEIAVRRAEPWSVMCAYNKVNGTYASENAFLLNDVLKREWGFQGFVVSDWGAVNDRVAGVRAGLHLEMPSSLGRTDAQLVEAVQRGELEETRLDEIVVTLLSVILLAKAQHRGEATVDFEAHHELARRAAAESAVLLKNDGILPLDFQKFKRLAVVGQFAKTPRYQGAGSSQVRPMRVTNAYDALLAHAGSDVSIAFAPGYRADGSSDPELVADAKRVAEQAELVIVFAGLPDSYESEAFDRTSLDLPSSHNELIDALHGVQKNVVVVLMNGSAVSMPWSSRVPAILEAWLAGQAGGEAIVDVLTGTVNPSGKLSETFAVRLEDTPAYLDFPSENGQARYGERVFIGYRYYEKRRISPLFPFGHGLSYSSFAYRDLRAEVRNLERDEFAVSVTVFVKNTSARSGKEIVQLYVREQSPRCLRPDKELKGFAKVLLEAGEERSLQFELESRDFAYFDTAVGEFVVDAGKFDILVGGSSNAPALVATVEVPQLRRSQRKLDRTSSLKDFLEHPRGQALYSAVLAALMPADESNHDVDADAQKKARDMTLAFLRELPVWKLPAMSGGKFSAADLDKLLEAVR